MKRIKLYHPRVFSDQEWAQGYYKRNVKNIRRTGQGLAGLLKKSKFEKGRILDAGCGFAAVPIEIAKTFPGAEITGIDLSEPLLELGQKLINEAGVSDQITLSKGDVQKIEFESSSFDVVINSYMVHIVEDPVTMVNQIERVAKNPGRILITDLRRNWLALLDKKLRTVLILEEGLEIVNKSNLRAGRYSNGPFWWDYMVGV